MDPRKLDNRTDYKKYSDLRTPFNEVQKVKKKKKRFRPGKGPNLNWIEKMYKEACTKRDMNLLRRCLNLASEEIIFSERKKWYISFIKLCHDSLEAFGADSKLLVPTFHDPLKTKFAWQLFGRGIKEDQLSREIDGNIVYSFLQTYPY
jgi:hypothetical protein